ncbi:ctenidin-1-like [Penaeus monodon]|uniref:ctenidin-1-like n=1 Tax=Penaeus monodon TaxID=6687 RepID=UPI0018A7553D|nr:ctenidin-1-like [Penaeus monodon]
MKVRATRTAEPIRHLVFKATNKQPSPHPRAVPVQPMEHHYVRRREFCVFYEIYSPIEEIFQRVKVSVPDITGERAGRAVYNTVEPVEKVTLALIGVSTLAVLCQADGGHGHGGGYGHGGGHGGGYGHGGHGGHGGGYGHGGGHGGGYGHGGHGHGGGYGVGGISNSNFNLAGPKGGYGHGGGHGGGYGHGGGHGGGYGHGGGHGGGYGHGGGHGGYGH